MFRTIDDYEKDYPNLSRHAAGYPTPDYLRSIIKIGNVGYKGEIEASTEGSELIRKAILDDDERTLYLQVWGGCNTISRALMDIQATHEAPRSGRRFTKRSPRKSLSSHVGSRTRPTAPILPKNGLT
ncbi:MAG: DUF1593 domain-containing protein, partial [Clostridia bacterium]|nr:DUF1593 domain-containing protein [Clostridia bacterium]